VTTSVVRTHQLSKRFRSGLLAVDSIDLDVHEGDLFGFLGPNGAGKTTTIRMLLALISPRPVRSTCSGTRSACTARTRSKASARWWKGRRSTPICRASGT
jgi:ABC-type multidrug transport system ATPase subunit